MNRCLDQVAGAAFLCSGQRCTAISRVIVRSELAVSVIEGLAARARLLVPGDGLQQGRTLGPLISDQHLSRVAEMVALGVKHGARVVTGGAVLTEGACAKGSFYAPTVLRDVTPDNPVAQEEIFGPVISVLKYDTLDEAMQLLNGVEFGLTDDSRQSRNDARQQYAVLWHPKFRRGALALSGRVQRRSTPLNTQFIWGGLRFEYGRAEQSDARGGTTSSKVVECRQCNDRSG